MAFVSITIASTALALVARSTLAMISFVLSSRLSGLGLWITCIFNNVLIRIANFQFPIP